MLLKNFYFKLILKNFTARLNTLVGGPFQTWPFKQSLWLKNLKFFVQISNKIHGSKGCFEKG